MQNQKLFSILALSMVLLAVANAQATYANYCNIQAAANKRFNTQYSGDISAQRCSFCQYVDTDNGESSSDTGNDNQVKGCSVCPSYTTATCTTCKENYVSTTANICIPCPTGSTCCAGNIASQDTYYQTAVKNAANTYTGLATVYSQLRTYTGLRQMTCKTGYVALGHYCAEIPANCASYIPKDNYYYCTQCQAGYYFGKNNQCLKECTASYVNNDKSMTTNVPCSACASESKCLACGTQNVAGAVAYYFLESSSFVTENHKDAGSNTNNPTQTTIQICRQCKPDNCIECNNATTCKTCAKHYFLANDGTCTKCVDPTDLFIASQAALVPLSYSACSSTNVVTGSYTWVQGQPNSEDTLNVASNRPLKTLGTGANAKYAYCEDKCTACDAKADGTGTNCTSCINGWFVDKSDPNNVVCTKCPEGTVLCKWNDVLKKDATNKNPQVIACAINPNDLRPPYSATNYLQYDFAVSGFTEQNYDKNNQCILNKNSCKTMINKFDGTNSVEALCSDCYKAGDFAINSAAKYDYFLTKDKKCLPCNFQFAKACELSTDQTAVQIKTCVDGFYPTPSSLNTCKPCSDIFAGCATCNNDGVCLSCESTTYFALTTGGKITACNRAYDDNTVQKANCLNWGTDSTTPTTYSCKACAAGSVLVSNVDVINGNETYKANLCMNCPKNCSSCGADKNRAVCNSCDAGYYLANNTCLALPSGCASFNGTKCTYCLYGYRLINDQWCSKCHGDDSFTGGEWFDCPGAQCPQGSSDSPTSSSSETSSTILSVVSLCLFVFALLI